MNGSVHGDLWIHSSVNGFVEKSSLDYARLHVKLLDGEPTKVEWEPKVNRWTGAEIQAVLKGGGDAGW